ncbi:MAG: DUF58 domain-containing protein, partial [Planctomycetota bacterium]|nr:DUF58 domain-containing protein [Planctomycetota bacterium]
AIRDSQPAPDAWRPSMTHPALRHDLTPVVVTDRPELDMPDVGLVELQDAETGRSVFLDTSRRRIRNRFARFATDLVASRDRTFRRMRLDPIEVETGDSFVEELTRYFQRRERRQRR